MKKRLAFVSKTMIVGGVEKVLAELLNTIDYNLYEVDLWLRQPGGDFHKLIHPLANVKYWGVSDTKKQLLNEFSKGHFRNVVKGIYFRCLLRVYAKNWVLNELYEVKAQMMCDDTEYDCVIAFQGMTPAVIATALYRLNAPKKIAWIHGKDSFLPQQAEQMTKEYNKFDHLFCVSKSTKNQFCEKFKGVEEKTSVFYNFIDDRNILMHAEECIDEYMKPISIVTVGRLSHLKGQVMIPQIVRLLLDAGYKVHWYLVGDGELRPVVEREIEKYDVAEHVLLLGTKTNPYPYIKKCDIYVQPSFSEGYCTTTVEAQILNKPIVTTDAPGMREQFVSGENGLIVDEMTPESLFEGIKLLLDHPEMMEKFKKNLAKETHDNSKELQKLYDFIES